MAGDLVIGCPKRVASDYTPNNHHPAQPSLSKLLKCMASAKCSN